MFCHLFSKKIKPFYIKINSALEFSKDLSEFKKELISQLQDATKSGILKWKKDNELWVSYSCYFYIGKTKFKCDADPQGNIEVSLEKILENKIIFKDTEIYLGIAITQHELNELSQRKKEENQKMLKFLQKLLKK